MNQISIDKFLAYNKKDIQVIDIREPYEYDNGHLDAINIPMDEIIHSIDKINLKKEIIIYCQTGKRAAAVVYMLSKFHGIQKIYNLSGGYAAYLEIKLLTQ